MQGDSKTLVWVWKLGLLLLGTLCRNPDGEKKITQISMDFYKDGNIISFMPTVVVIVWGQAGLGPPKIPKADI